ncbi:type II secretion system F family protein [Planctobacterium marinum]|uniref:Type II secretion system protein GspF n=1 Tax=Planctobacterium marinum TaxID=1631968 RepID=A0AA48HTH9_9ALTE|nr:type II secretion system protein GspF [Planctobacterium marinum]
MPLYKFKAYDKQGHSIEDYREASDVNALRHSLSSEGLMVASVSLQSQSINIKLPFQSQNLSLKDMEFLTSELAILLNSGVKVDKGLEIIARSKKDPSTSRVVAEILKKLKGGSSVSDAFKTSRNDFDPLYINLIAIGEKSGKLPQVFAGLASDLKFQQSLRAKIVQALTYPSVILFVCVMCVLFVFNYIVPQMGSIFDKNDDIPVYTRLLLGASEWMINYQLWLLAGIVAVIFAIAYQWKSPAFRTRMAQYFLSVPIISDLIKQVERIRFNSAMALMVSAGVKVDHAISAAIANIQNPVIRNSLDIANNKIKKGEPLAKSLSMTPIYPSFYISLLEVGEESGELAKIFNEIAQRSKTEFEGWTDRVTNILEPLLILVMGGIVGSVVITMLLSVVSVNDISI